MHLLVCAPLTLPTDIVHLGLLHSTDGSLSSPHGSLRSTWGLAPVTRLNNKTRAVATDRLVSAMRCVCTALHRLVRAPPCVCTALCVHRQPFPHTLCTPACLARQTARFARRSPRPPPARPLKRDEQSWSNNGGNIAEHLGSDLLHNGGTKAAARPPSTSAVRQAMQCSRRNPRHSLVHCNERPTQEMGQSAAGQIGVTCKAEKHDHCFGLALRPGQAILQAGRSAPCSYKLGFRELLRKCVLSLKGACENAKAR